MSDEPISVRETIENSISELRENNNEHNSERNNERNNEPRGATNNFERSGDNKVPFASEDVSIPETLKNHELSQHWANLPAHVKRDIIRRECEYANGVKNYADHAHAYREIEKFIEPHRQDMQRAGITTNQVIDRLFWWFHNLNAPGPEHRIKTFRALADSFGITPYFTGGAQNDNRNNNLNMHASNSGYYSNDYSQQYASYQQTLNAMHNAILRFRNDHPRFDEVREKMQVL